MNSDTKKYSNDCFIDLDTTFISKYLNDNMSEEEKIKEKWTNSIESLESKINNFKDLDGKDSAIEFLLNTIKDKAKRNISRNDLINLLICISQGFLTILAGEPGIGKTSIINIISKILGLSDCNRYVEVAVEKGWTSKKDLIGYYNPLNKLFESSNKEVLEVLEFLDIEYSQNSKDYPFLLLLDEANLSQMEYYWADFMSLCDLSKTNRKILLSNNKKTNITQSLRFIATVNTDSTTEILSPRLIDRAWIIIPDIPKIEDLNSIEVENLCDTYSLVTVSNKNIFNVIKDLPKLDDKIDDITNAKFMQIKNAFENKKIYLSPRILIMIKEYCLIGEQLFEKEEGKLISLDYAISQKVLPKINGFGEDFKIFLENILKICTADIMPKSNKLIQNIIDTGEKTNYFNFFSR